MFEATRTASNSRRHESENDRAVSTALDYVILLGILTVLISVIVVGATDYVKGQREEVVRSDLTVQGNRLAADLTRVDALAGTVGSGGAVSVQSPLDDQVNHQHYRVFVESASPGNTYALTLESADPAISVTVRVRTRHPVETGTFSGGELLLSYDPTSGTLEVTDD